MHPILRRDIKQLVMDTERIQKGLEMLVHSRTASAKEHQHMDLMELIKHVQRLDLDLGTILSGCVFLGRQYWKGHNLRLIKSLHWSCDVMRSLLQDLNKIRTAMNEGRFNHSHLRQLIIDWGRLRESIYETQEWMKYPQRRRKNAAWSRPNLPNPEGYDDEAFRVVNESSSTGP